MTDSRVRPAVRDREERDRLVLKYLFLPRRVVADMRHTEAVRRLGREDAEQVGMLGLIRAATLYDPARRSTKPGFSGRQASFKSYAYRAIWHRISDNRHDGLIAVPIRPRGAMRQAAARRLLSGCVPLPDPGLWEPEATAPPEAPDAAPLEAALRTLPAQERAVVRLRFYDGLTLEAAGRRLGVSRQRVLQVQRQALGRLRRALGEEG